MKPVEYVRPIFELTVPFDGPLRRKLAAPVTSVLERLLLLRKLDQFYTDVARGESETHFIERVLEALDVSYGIGQDDLARIPREGPLVVVANHPMGIVDGVIDYRHELSDLVTARNPFRAKTIKDRAFRVGAPLLADIEDVSALISDIETDRKGIPILLKQYLKLGGKLLGFNIDHNFSDALDGLILVDLTLSDDRMLSRLMGEESASRFLEFHGRRYLLAS